MMRPVRPTVPLLLALAALLGCSGSGTGPDDSCPPGVICTGGTPTLVNLGLTAADLPAQSVSFWARRGSDRAGALFFRKPSGELERLVRLRVRSNSLERRPDGTAFAPGDSVLITMTLANPSKILFDFQPSGLRFSAQDPAELELEYGDASRGDINGDGQVNQADRDLIARLAVWLQESASSPFFRVENSFNDSTIEEIEADILGFTRYGIAY